MYEKTPDYRWRVPAPAFEGPEIPELFNADYSEALVAGTAEGMTPDCGHVTCSTHCDPAIRKLRARRAEGMVGA